MKSSSFLEADMYGVRGDICRMRLLVVDDDFDVNRMLCVRLSKNYPTQSIFSAHDTESAIEITSEIQPDIFVVDVSMPTFVGLELSRKLISENKGRIIINMSAGRDYELINRCYEAGARYFIAKPIEFDRLFHKLDSLMLDLFYRRFNKGKKLRRFGC